MGLFTFLLTISLIGIVYTTTAKDTILNPEFIEQELEDRNLYSIAKEEVIDQIEDPWLAEIVEESLKEEWMKEQAHGLIHSFLPYLKAKTDELELKVSTIALKENIKVALQESLPPELENAPENEKEAYLTNAYSELDNLLPDEVDIVESADIKEEDLNQPRMIVSYFYLVSDLMLAVAVVLILLIILISRRLKSISRALGASALAGGVISYGLSVVALNFASAELATADLPSFLTVEMVLDTIRDILAPAMNYAIILSIVGLALLGFSILYKS